MPAFPMVFQFATVLVTEKFRARVRGTGRALVMFEDDQWWCSGVEPGGMIESGATPVHSYLGFRRALDEILSDLAEESEGVDDFTASVLAFFHQTNAEDDSLWIQAVESMRRGETNLPPEVNVLARASATTLATVEIEVADRFSQQVELLSVAGPETPSRAA